MHRWCETGHIFHDHPGSKKQIVALGTCPVGGSEFTAGSSTFVDLLKKQYGCLDSKCQGSGDVDLMQMFSYPDGNMGNVVMECFRCLSIFICRWNWRVSSRIPLFPQHLCAGRKVWVQGFMGRAHWKIECHYYPLYSLFLWYGGWKKSCTALDGWNPIKNGISHLSTGAGFLPSTVSSCSWWF